MNKPLRFFVSSPGDVKVERECAASIIHRLDREFRRFFGKFEVILWEREPLTASGSFQDVITPPGETDVVIVIFWSRFGTPLPEKTDKREYRGIDGRAPVTGTEWEFEDALQAYREHGKPDILVFRKTGDITISAIDTNAQKKPRRSWTNWPNSGRVILSMTTSHSSSSMAASPCTTTRPFRCS